MVTQFHIDADPVRPLIDWKKALFIAAIVWIPTNLFVALFVGVMAYALGGGMIPNLPWIKKDQRPSQFTVSPERLEVNGRQIAVGDIQRLLIRNPYDVSNQSTTVTDRAPSLGVVAGRAWRAKVQERSYRVDADSMGVPVTLATGLTEPAAAGLVTEIAAITVLR